MKNIILFLVFIFSSQSLANEIWKINDDHSDLGFTVNYLKVSSVRGRFNKLSGEVELKNNKPVKVNLIIGAKSISTGNKLRDSHLRRSDFLHVKKHPKINFTSKSITTIDKNVFEVKGFLKIQKIKRPLSLIVTLSETVKDTWGKQHRFAVYSGQLDRYDYGLKWNKTLPGSDFLVSNRIILKGSIQLQPTGKATASSKHMIPDNKSIRKREKLNRGEVSKEATRIDRPKLKIFKNKNNTFEKSNFIKKNKKEIKSKEPDSQWPISRILALLYHGLFGFIGSLTVFIGIKKAFLHINKDKYDETNLIGHFSDAIGIIFCLLWAISFYHFVFYK
ncbi:MAG: YceI family protein [Bacteriovoracaceae bacterium]|nr:YceI family protein [Bacteriovoracaceae bacterium]